MLHSVSVPFVPAFGAAFSVTVTVADAFGHGATPVTVYVYTPGPIVAGSYIPPTTGLGPLHAPPGSGTPPKLFTKAIDAPVEQSVIDPFDPAVAARFSVTVTVAVAFAHGATPVTV